MPSFRAKDLSAWSAGVWVGGEPASVAGVCTDTRTLRPGDLYVALRGPRFDGHDFIREAFERGAAAALVETPDGKAAGPQLRVADTRRALSDLASGYRSTLTGRIFGVTGTVGKTTVKELTADALATAGPTARTRGNWNNDIGLPLSLLAMEPTARFGVFEVGTNHPGEIAALCKVLRPEWGMVTAVGPGHLEFFKTVEAVAREKSSVLRALPENGLAFLNRDDEWFEVLRAAAPCPVVTVSLGAEADYRAWPGAGGQEFTVEERATKQRVPLISPLPGRYMILNALFAVAVARRAGVSWEAIGGALGRYRPPPMRWNRAMIRGVEFINDAYNANPASMRAALETFAGMPVTGRRWLVLGGMLELGESESEWHHQLGRELASGPWAGLLAVGVRGAWIAEGAREIGMDARRLFPCADAAAAAARLRQLAQPGDAVLLKASRGEKVEDVQILYDSGGKGAPA